MTSELQKLRTDLPRPHPRCRRLAACAWIAIWTIAGVTCSIVLAQPEDTPPEDELRLFEVPAYDQITLKDKSVIKVTPVEFPAGRVPENPKPSDLLVVRLTERPTEEYQLHWRDVVEYKRFAQLILDEAQRLTAAGKLPDAFAYFDYLERNYPTLAELKPATEKYLYEDAKDCQRRKKYSEALAVLDELHRRNPSFAGLDRVWGAATDKIIEGLVAKKDYLATRQRLFNLQSRFPQESFGLKWQRELESQSSALIAKAQAEVTAGHLDVAREHVFAALERWPRYEAARKLALDLFARAPALAVGVTQPLPTQPQDPLTDWASRRASRLLARSLLELSGYDAEGGVYQSTLGEFAVEELGLELNVRLRPDIAQKGGEPFSGYDLSQFLIHNVQSEPDSLLAQMLDHVSVRNIFDVDITLRRPHMRPEALLSRPIAVASGEGGDWQIAAMAPFHVAERTAARVRYVANPALRATSATGPSEIYEQNYPTVSAAISALQRGEVLLVDRLNPWDVASMRKTEGIVVEAYAVPTVHVLVPNLKHPLLARRLFRRALVYGINREAILQVQLLRGAALAESRVTSGPFPFGYAYNDSVETRPWEPQIAMTLAQIAYKELANETKPATATGPGAPKAAVAESKGAGGDDAKPSETPPAAPNQAAPSSSLRLAHPPTKVARLACRAIQRQLKLIGVAIELVELAADSSATAPETYDLVYTELQLEEPIVDARRLFGAGGLASGSSPHLDEALVRLEAAADWRSAREELHEIHQIAADDVAVIPLWQMSEHYAYRNTIRGIPSRSVVLYQDVDKWQVEPYLPSPKQ